MKETMEKEKLQALKNFFESDMKIKETLVKLAPSKIDDLDESSRIEYVDKLYKGLENLEEEFLSSVEKFEFAPEVNDAIKKYFKKEKETLLVEKYEPGICQKLYASQFSMMDKKFVEEVKKECVGYTMAETPDLIQLIKKAKTTNELLHAMHSYIVNNEKILESIQVIGQKENTIGELITLYGEKNVIADKIFDKFPLEMDCGITDIISLKNKILMMVRDRGHALTIDIDTSKQDDIEVRYFVPKLCNQKMIEKLPGINKSGITENGASGFFVSSNEKIAEKIFDFIEKVPTDADMILANEINQFNENEVNVKPDNKSNNEQQEDKKTKYIFNEEDAKEIAMKQGKDGRKISKIEWIKTKLIELKQNTKNITKRNERDNDRNM